MRNQNNTSVWIILNGKTYVVKFKLTILELLEFLNSDRPEVIVEYNQKFLMKNLFDKTFISNGDRLELITLVGGG